MPMHHEPYFADDGFHALAHEAGIRDLIALDAYHLQPSVLHTVEEVSTNFTVLDHTWVSPMITVSHHLKAEDKMLQLAPWQEGFTAPLPAHIVPLLTPEKMGRLMPKVRQLVACNASAMALDLTVLAHIPPFGKRVWRPPSREDLAELRAAAGCPIWLYGVASSKDAVTAAEAGIDAIIVSSTLGRHINSPATVEVLPEIIDAIAGMTQIYAGGKVRSGIDVFRYLAVGAEAVVVHSDRNLSNLQAELEYAMRLTGCETPLDISYDAIHVPLFDDI